MDMNAPSWVFAAPPGGAAALHERRDGGLMIASNGGRNCVGRWIGPDVAVSAGTPYEIIINADVCEAPPRDLPVYIYALVNWLAQDGRVITRDYISDYSTDGNALVLSCTLPAPKDAVRAHLELDMKWMGSGRVVFTGASIDEAPPASAKKVRLAAAFTSFPGTKEGNLNALLAVIDRAAREKPDLLCLGETALSYGLSIEEAAVTIPGPEVSALCERAKRHGMIIVTGLAQRDGDIFYNSAVVIGGDGALIGTYHKVNLPLAEIEDGYSPGYDYPVFDTPVGKVGVMICWDMVFPETARILADRGAEILCAPSYWFSDLQTPARAADNAVYVVVSAPRFSAAPCRVIDPKGRVVAQCAGEEEHESGVCVAEVDIRQRHYSYWRSLGPCYGEHKSILHRERRTDTYDFAPVDAG